MPKHGEKTLRGQVLYIHSQVEAQQYFSNCDCPEFLQHAERRLDEEKERVGNYLDATSEHKITRVLENELIFKQASLGSRLIPLIDQFTTKYRSHYSKTKYERLGVAEVIHCTQQLSTKIHCLHECPLVC